MSLSPNLSNHPVLHNIVISRGPFLAAQAPSHKDVEGLVNKSFPLPHPGSQSTISQFLLPSLQEILGDPSDHTAESQIHPLLPPPPRVLKILCLMM